MCAGAARETVEQVEQELGVELPEVHKAFLRFADGGVLGIFIFYSAGDGIHRAERLLAAYRRYGPDCPILAIGRDASDDFGFLRGELSARSPAVYFMSHETWELFQVAPSFLDFVSGLRA